MCLLMYVLQHRFSNENEVTNKLSTERGGGPGDCEVNTPYTIIAGMELGVCSTRGSYTYSTYGDGA